MTHERLLTVKEAAEWLNVSPSFIYDWAAAGRLPCVRLGGHLHFDRCDLTRWLAARKRDLEMPKLPRGMFRRGKSWYIRIYEKGGERWRSLGPDYSEALRQHRELLKKGEPPVKMTVADAAKRWLSSYVATARDTKNQKLTEVRTEQYLLRFLGLKLLGKVEPDDLRSYRLWLEETKLKPQSIVHLLSDARCLFLWCRDSGYLEASPVPRRLFPRLQERSPDRLSDEEAMSVASLPGSLGFAVRLALATGLRWGEMARALTSDIENVEHHKVLIVRQTKSGKVRRVPLPPEIVRELRGHVGKLIAYGERSASSFNRDVRRKTKRLGSPVPGFHVHQLRHTFACQWLETGGSLPALQQLLGHASIVTTQRYARLTDEAVFEEARRVATEAMNVATEP